MLADGRLDVGVGRVSGAPTAIASELFRLDPLGVLVRSDHAFATRTAVPVTALSDETLLLADQDRAPEFNEFVAEVCRTAGFFPALFHGSVQNLRAAVDLVVEGRCVLCVPASRGAVVAGRHVAAARTARTPLSVVDPVARAGTVPLRRRPGGHRPPPLRGERLAHRAGRDRQLANSDHVPGQRRQHRLKASAVELRVVQPAGLHPVRPVRAC